MHVLHVAPYFPPTWAYGGIPRVVDGLSRAQAAAGAQVSVLTTDALDGAARAGLPLDRAHGGVRVLTAPNLSNRLAYRHQLFLPEPGALASARATLEGGPPDVVHLHGHRHLLNSAAVRWARRWGAPVVLTANGTLVAHERKVAVKRLWDVVLGDPVLRAAAAFVAVSGADQAAHLRAGLPADRVHRIPNGLDMGEFAPLPARGAFRARHALGEGPLVAYLGQISPRKGVEHLVAAFAGGALAPAQLVVAGNDMGGLDRAAAAAAGVQGVRFVGLLRGEERLSLLADADVLVYATQAEVFGLVPFEGLLCGAPVVVADDCGCGELIREAGAGLLVRYGDVDGLRARIRTLLSDRVAAAAMVGRGRRYIEATLQLPAVAAAHLELYGRLRAQRAEAGWTGT
jgi:glycosyltransferase involved in cell wall biosynthesis